MDRGWFATGNKGASSVDSPAPPAGRVTVVGWVRTDATGRAASVTDGSARAVSSAAIAPTLDGRVFGGFIDLERQSPEAAKPLVPAEQPDLGNGPHFFYGLQWWFFGVLAVFGFLYLAYDERRKLTRASQDGAAQGSQGTDHAAVDREHHAADEARSG